MSIFIHHDSVSLEINQSTIPIQEPSIEEIEIGIYNLQHHQVAQYTLQTADEESLLSMIRERFEWLEAAGGVIQTSDEHYLLIYRRGRWDLPKGKIDPGETPPIAAIREIEEETGLSQLELIKSLAPSYHIYQLNGKWILKKTHWFQFKTEKIRGLQLQKEEDIEEGRWMDPAQIKEVWGLIYPSLQPLLRAFIS